MSQNPFIRLAWLVEKWKRLEREDLVFASPHMPEPATTADDESAMFKGRCPLCRRWFTAASPLALNELLTDHFSEEHATAEDAISWNDQKV